MQLKSYLMVNATIGVQARVLNGILEREVDVPELGQIT